MILNNSLTALLYLVSNPYFLPLLCCSSVLLLVRTVCSGAIPIVESNAGMDRTYSNLPVLVIENYSQLNKDLLERAYDCFVKNAHKYRYFHLTSNYWKKLVFRAVKSASIAHVNRNHPFRNLHCNYLNSSTLLLENIRHNAVNDFF